MTTTILGINIAMFLLLVVTGGFGGGNLQRFGAQVTYLSDWWRYITSMFLHGGFAHLLFNGFALYVFAPPMERLLKPLKYTILYFASGIAGGLLSQWALREAFPPVVSVGASGAIYGLFGAYLYIIIYGKGIMDLQSTRTIQVLLVIGAIYSFMPGVNLYAHLGGLIGGFICFAVMVKGERQRQNRG